MKKALSRIFRKDSSEQLDKKMDAHTKCFGVMMETDNRMCIFLT